MYAITNFSLRTAQAKFLLVAAVIGFCLLVQLWTSGVGGDIESFTPHAVSPQRLLFYNDVSKHAQNATLGFEKMFYISMPHRPDRQDSMTMLASLTNVQLTLEDGVYGNTIHDKAKPEGSGTLSPEQLGCWRGHANIWRRMIRENVQTAIILEDDADWDVEVHDIFQEMSRQMRRGTLRKEPATHYELGHTPYGLDWDILYIGTCWNMNAEERPIAHMYEDKNAPNLTEMAWDFQRELGYWGADQLKKPRVRIIAPAWYPVCTVGYALTLQGAQKLLYLVGNEGGMAAPIDLAMISRIQSGHVRALTVVPPVINPWRSGKPSDSDISDLSDPANAYPAGSANLLQSGRKALADLFNKIIQDQTAPEEMV